MSLVLFLGFVVVMVRRSHSEVEELLEEMGEGDVDGVELMIRLTETKVRCF